MTTGKVSKALLFIDNLGMSSLEFERLIDELGSLHDIELKKEMKNFQDQEEDKELSLRSIQGTL